MNNPDTLDEILTNLSFVSDGISDEAISETKKQLLEWRATTLLEMIGEDEPMVDIAGKELGSGDIAHLDFDGLENAKVSVSIVTANGRNNLRAELRQQIEQQTKEAE